VNSSDSAIEKLKEQEIAIFLGHHITTLAFSQSYATKTSAKNLDYGWLVISTYVMLSRISSWDDLAILRPFEESVLQRVPDERLLELFLICSVGIDLFSWPF